MLMVPPALVHETDPPLEILTTFLEEEQWTEPLAEILTEPPEVRTEIPDEEMLMYW